MSQSADYFDHEARRLHSELDGRSTSLPLPHKGDTFVAVRAVEAEVGIYFRVPSIDLDLPMYVVKWTIPPGEAFRLEYEPDHAHSTHCSLRPMRYSDFEAVFVDAQNRRGEFYSHYSVSVSYADLADGFRWRRADQNEVRAETANGGN